jgi:agmatine deiminase
VENIGAAEAIGFRQPAEWESHQAVWLAWPSHRELWQDNLQTAQDEFYGLCEAISDIDPMTGKARGEFLNILVPSLAEKEEAEQKLKNLPHRLFEIPFGDIWLRDTAPIFLKDGKTLAAACFKFNGWGEKYIMPGDSQVAERIASQSQARPLRFSFILEGGSVEVDGEGTVLTSRQCLLNMNRNPEMDQAQVEKEVCKALGGQKVLWLQDGLLNDHTDGHIDTIARYVGPAKVLCMKATSVDDPNKEVMEKIARDLLQFVDAKGRPLTVGFVPSPGRVLNEDGELMPASYLNFYIGNTTVVVPTYGMPSDQAAVKAIGEWFPTRRTVGRPAKTILTGGGAFHCISQQQPSGV